MRKLLISTITAISLAAGGAAVAQSVGDQAIPSDQDGALDEPETWNCTRIQPEYSRWLDDGNSPESWRYVGKTYREVDTGELYTWQDWLDWADDNGCPIGLAEGSVSGGPSGGLIAGAITAFGTGLIVAANGSGPKSPG